MQRACLSSSLLAAALLSSSCAGCSGQVDSEEEARLAYLGLDRAVERALQLGFDGFNAAANANIPAQSDDGEESGTMTVSGQVDQGSSDNKGMRLDVALAEYSDGSFDDPETEEEEELEVIYETEEASPLSLELLLRDIPGGTLENGTFAGTVVMDGDIVGELVLALVFAGDVEAGGDGQTVQRVEGTTHITGTATSETGEYQVDVER